MRPTKKAYLGVFLVAAASIALPGSVRAHHGDAGRYVAEVSSLTGIVAQFVLINPHSYIVLDVTEDGKTTKWTGELNTSQTLARDFGWTSASTKKWIGSRVTITGRRLKSGAAYMNLTDRANIVLADTGQEIFRTANFGQPPPAQESQQRQTEAEPR